MKPGRKKGNRLLAQDIRMRAEGYVTAWEVAEALGVSTTTIHYRIKEGHIAGIGVPVVGGSYTRWYVDACAIEKAYPPSAPKALRAALVKLCAAVRTAKKVG